MIKTAKFQIIIQYDTKDIQCRNGEAWIDRADINGFDAEASTEVIAIANDECGDQFFEDWQYEQGLRAVEAEEYRAEALAEAKWEAYR